MAKKTRSARGEVVDFDLLTIKQQLAAKPTPVGVADRRRFIDERDGLKSRRVVAAPVPDALAIASAAAEASAAAPAEGEVSTSAKVAKAAKTKMAS